MSRTPFRSFHTARQRTPKGKSPPLLSRVVVQQERLNGTTSEIVT